MDATTLLRSVTVVCDGVQVEHLPISGTLANLLSAAFGAAAAWFGGML